MKGPVTLVSPEGEEHVVINVMQFCVERGLCATNMYHVIDGVRRHTGGWTCPEAGYVRMYRGEICQKYL